MVLEPLSAFAVACNVLQVIETGATVLSKASEYKAAKDGMLAEHKDLRAILFSLQRLNDDLQSGLSTPGERQGLNVAEQRLRESNEECLKLSKDFVALLDQLRVQNSNALSETIRKSVKSIWYRDKIKAVDKNLSRARDNLSLSLLVYIYNKQGDMRTQPTMLQQSSDMNRVILEAVSNSSSLIGDELKTLTQRLDGLKFESMRKVLEDFGVEHRQFLSHFSQQLDSISAMYNKVQTQTMDVHMQSTNRRLIESWFFPQVQDRKDQLAIMYHETYRWVLDRNATADISWDNLVGWLNDLNPSSNIYWIGAKPGAGKSSLVRFLDDELSAYEHMQDWAGPMRVIKLSYYLWSAGNLFQKSIAGFLRTILHQLFDEVPELLPQVISHHKWNMAQSGNQYDITWTDHELREMLSSAIKFLRPSAKVFLLIDGLDEIEGDDDVREELVELLKGISSHPNVKLCAASRCWTVFQDAFATCSQMRLEDLNRQDIEMFVIEQFRSQYRYRQMLIYDTAAAEGLVSTVISRAEGVFLWAKLVVKELVRGLRDGDSNRVLQQKLQSIPGDLDRYFRQIIESIEPHHRKEACMLLQLALYDEREFVALNPLRLIDLIFMDDADVDFALVVDYTLYLNTLQTAEALYYKLESTLRRLLSRSKGLLDCYYHPCAATRYVDLEYEVEEEEEQRWSAENLGSRLLERPAHTITSLSTTLISSLHKSRYLAYNFHIDFMHRSLRDYLLQPETQEFLHRYTYGPFDARNYLRNARLMEVYMNMSINFSPEFTVGLASYFISTLSLLNFRHDARCVRFATKFQNAVDYLHRGFERTAGGWYICQSLEAWFREQSTFISLAIDFALTGYLATVLTAQIVRGKPGRPLLDHALRSRFAPMSGSSVSMTIGNQAPIPELIQSLLSFGADPNQTYDGISIWPLFLSFAASGRFKWSAVERVRIAYFNSLVALLDAGADLSIPKSVLSASLDHGVDTDIICDMMSDEPTDIDGIFRHRWPGLSSKACASSSTGLEFSVSDILECFISVFGNDVERLKEVVRQRQESGAKGYSEMGNSQSL